MKNDIQTNYYRNNYGEHNQLTLGFKSFDNYVLRTHKHVNQMKITAFWSVMACSTVEVCQCFRGTWQLYHQNDE
jgi:hypothetical protein